MAEGIYIKQENILTEKEKKELLLNYLLNLQKNKENRIPLETLHMIIEDLQEELQNLK